MARFFSRALPLASRSSSPLHSPISSSSASSRLLRSRISPHASFSSSPFDGIFASLRGYQNSRMRRGSEKESSSEKKPKIFFKFLYPHGMRKDPELMRVLNMLGPNVFKAMDVAFDGLHFPGYKTRYSHINDVSIFEKVELSLLFSNDDCMRKHNKDMNGVDATRDVLPMPRHIPHSDNQTLSLGDIVISVETAARQAEVRGHTLLDEFRILMVHGLLHLLGFDHEKSEEAEKEMQKAEEQVLKSLGWKGKGLITNKKNAEGGRACFENSWMKSPSKEKKPQFIVKFLAKDKLCEGPEVMRILAMLGENVRMAMRVAFDGLHFSGYKTRDTSVSDVSKFEKVELSLCFSNDNGMQEHNKAWKGIDATTDVLSMSRHIRLDNQTLLLLGDIVISVETAARQAEERGHTLLDEFRIQMVHGLLHLLGFDPEMSEEAEKEMQKEEERVLKRLGWEGKGLIANKRRS